MRAEIHSTKSLIVPMTIDYYTISNIQMTGFLLPLSIKLKSKNRFYFFIIF